MYHKLNLFPCNVTTILILVSILFSDPYSPFLKIEDFLLYLVCQVFWAHLVGNMSDDIKSADFRLLMRFTGSCCRQLVQDILLMKYWLQSQSLSGQAKRIDDNLCGCLTAWKARPNKLLTDLNYYLCYSFNIIYSSSPSLNSKSLGMQLANAAVNNSCSEKMFLAI